MSAAKPLRFLKSASFSAADLNQCAFARRALSFRLERQHTLRAVYSSGNHLAPNFTSLKRPRLRTRVATCRRRMPRYLSRARFDLAKGADNSAFFTQAQVLKSSLLSDVRITPERSFSQTLLARMLNTKKFLNQRFVKRHGTAIFMPHSACDVNSHPA